MNRHLIIDGNDCGTVIGYRQNRERNQWVFLMEAGYYISIDFMNIKSFDSGNAELIVYTFQSH